MDDVRQRAVVLVLLVGFVLATSPVAHAAATLLVVDSRSPALVEAKDGSWTATLGFTNLTTDQINLRADPRDTADKGCDLRTDPAQLAPAEHTEVSIAIPAACSVRDDGFDFTISTTDAKPANTTFAISAAPKPDTSTPEWRALWAFPIALAALLF